MRSTIVRIPVHKWVVPQGYFRSACCENATDEVFAAVFHPDGGRIASAGRDRVICI
jgi:hypothetical protein